MICAKLFDKRHDPLVGVFDDIMARIDEAMGFGLREEF